MMKNTFNKRVSVLAFFIFLMTAPMAQGIGLIGTEETTGQTKFLRAANVRQAPVKLAQNEENTNGEKAQTKTGTKDPVSAPESSSESDKKRTSTKSTSDPLKSFRPSEEIAAEQAVDFPVDI